ncbi:MAG: hypothetical protein WCP01_04290 [Methylococcaceae bacterium]
MTKKTRTPGNAKPQLGNQSDYAEPGLSAPGLNKAESGCHND